jgi:hypothetical protein
MKEDQQCENAIEDGRARLMNTDESVKTKKESAITIMYTIVYTMFYTLIYTMRNSILLYTKPYAMLYTMPYAML